MEEVLSLAELTELAFKDLYIKYNIADAPEKRRADIIDSLWGDIYKTVFKPGDDEIRVNNCKSKLKPWNVEEVEEVCNIFIKLNKRYGGVIKYNQFSNLTGINRYTLYLWHKNNNTNGYIFSLNSTAIDEEQRTTIYILNNNNVDVVYNGNFGRDRESNTKYLSSLRFDVIKKLQEEMQDANTNGLSNDTMGQIMRANNEEELGKLYEPKRIMQTATARAVLTAAELPRLGTELNQIPAQLPQNEL